MLKKIATIAATISLTGCFTPNILINKPDAQKFQIKEVCIERNPKVLVEDFVPVVREGFRRHGMMTELYERGQLPDKCLTTLKYTASRGWDFVPFMNRAELTLYQGGYIVGTVSYFHKGGLSFSKFDSTAEKMDPVLDDLLSGYKAR